VRNNCRMVLRARRAVPVAEPEPLLPAAAEPGPGELLDRAATRDWVHHAVATLPEPVREVTVLRYFSAYSSYRQIAGLCAVPEHTVRSRLRDGRQALRRALRETAAVAHTDFAATVAASRAGADATLEAAHSGHVDRMLHEAFHPDARLTVLGGLRGDLGVIPLMLDYTLGAGVRTRLREATASRDLMVWETDFLNPADAPGHCPPGMVWLHSMRDGRTAHLRLAYRLE
jgi:hypothetical protein